MSVGAGGRAGPALTSLSPLPAGRTFCMYEYAVDPVKHTRVWSSERRLYCLLETTTADVSVVEPYTTGSRTASVTWGGPSWDPRLR